MACVAFELRKSMHMRKVTVSRMHERYVQTELTFRITYVFAPNINSLYVITDILIINILPKHLIL